MGIRWKSLGLALGTYAFFGFATFGIYEILEEEIQPGIDRAPAAVRKPAYSPVKLRSPAAFSKIKIPTDDPPAIYGKHWSGCLQGASLLPQEGSGFQRMRLSRNRGFGHPELVRLLKDYASKTKKEGIGDILIGDMSQAQGGPMVGGHRSHQTGLDADIWFVTSKRFTDGRLKHADRESLSAIDMTTNQGQALSKDFGEAQIRLLEIAARDRRVQRVFVNPRIKQALCEHPMHKQSYWIRKVRPAFGHNFHFHVRLACPRFDRSCFDQPDTKGLESGCDAELKGWFQADGRVKSAPPLREEEPAVFVPRECLSLLANAEKSKNRRPSSLNEILTREDRPESVQ